MRIRLPTALCLVVLMLMPAAFAVEPGEMLADPALEARARALSKTLRCMVCQNESIDDSNAPLARDLRVLVRERIRAGESDAAVRDFLVARYGEFILLEPRFGARTFVLWALPWLVLLTGGAAMVLTLRWRRRPALAALTPEEKQRLAALTGKNKNS